MAAGHGYVVGIDLGTTFTAAAVATDERAEIVSLGHTSAVVPSVVMVRADGEVLESNFDTYRSLRIDEMPDIQVHIVPSGEAPTGVGEPGVPPLAPALANALFAATGQRIDRLPIGNQVREAATA